MNILYYFAEDDSYMSQWQRVHIFDELERHGHTVKVFNPLKFKSINQANERLIRYIRDNKASVDLFMTCAKSDFLYEESITEVKKYSLPTLLICFDNLHAPFIHQKIAPYFDLVWLTSQETEQMFQDWGCNTCFMPYAANPNAFRPTWDREIDGVGFIGTPYGSRVDKINFLLKNNVSCYIYSDSVINKGKKKGQPDEDNSFLGVLNFCKSFYSLSKFKIGRKVIKGAIKKKIFSKYSKSLIDNKYLELSGSVDFSKMGTLYSNFAISLGITELRNTYVLENPVHKLHLRTFEIPMSGGLQISHDVDELAQYFEDGKEIILYGSEDELISKAKFYLKESNKGLRKKMKLRARERAKNEHSWINRFNTIFSKLSLLN